MIGSNPDYSYDSTFFDYVDQGSLRSARVVVPLVRSALRPATIVDFGCGRGAWLSTWIENGVQVVGVDGSYVEKNRLPCPST